MERIKDHLLKNWTFWRGLRLTLSLVFLSVGLVKSDYILVAAGAFLMIQALANTCVSCVGNNCNIPQK